MAERLSFWRSVAGAGQPWQRRGGAVALVLAVSGVHSCVGNRLAQSMIDAGTDRAMPARIEVAYVRELEPTAPPAVAPAPV